jgi:Bor protein
MSRFNQWLWLWAALLSPTGCYHYQVNAVQAPVGIEAERRGEGAVLWSLFWGLSQENFDTTGSCHGLPIKSVTTHSNMGFALVTVVSLGIASPVTVTWVCAKETTPVVEGDRPDDPI